MEVRFETYQTGRGPYKSFIDFYTHYLNYNINIPTLTSTYFINIEIL